mmetsp:Transcript_4775/g.11949  ORF Transcript_4775/g.11949 Transcript_4775/m.11949 type:complete len:196 (+) Transcript_4775:157-744(+)|eukprot:jgi/Tetstr1/423889/TSEL_014512.t1
MNLAQQQAYRTMPPPAPQHQHHVYQNQIVCTGCQTLLMYPQGASNVRCSRCHHITAVTQGGPEMAQLVCSGCRVLLMYPRGAGSVQCSCCSTINSAAVQTTSSQLGHVVCGGCTVTLMYALGAQSVKCALCNFVTGVPPPPPMYQQVGPSTSAAPSPAPTVKVLTNAVVVENPSTLDENGNEVPSISVGVQKMGG